MGREIRVTPAALAEFGRALAANDRPLKAPSPPTATTVPKPPSPSCRKRQIAEAEAFLRAEGVM